MFYKHVTILKVYLEVIIYAQEQQQKILGFEVLCTGPPGSFTVYGLTKNPGL